MNPTNAEVPAEPANKIVSWPSVPQGITVEIAFRCSKCGNVLRFSGKKEPTDADVMVHSFVKKHAEGDCH